MPITLAAPNVVLVGAFVLASTSALADDDAAKVPGKPPTPLVEGGKDSKGTAKPLPTKKAKGWNEMTPGEKKAANDLWLSRPKKWDDMTPAEQDAAKKAWFFSTGDW